MNQTVVPQNEVVADANIFDRDALGVARQTQPVAAERPHVVIVDDGRNAHRVD